MAALSQNNVDYETKRTDLGLIRQMVVDDSVTVYVGGAVGINSGKVRPVDADNYPCVGFAMDSGTAGETIRVMYKHQVAVTVSSIATSNINDPIYATTDNDFQTSNSSATLVGYVVDLHEDSNKCWILADVN